MSEDFKVHLERVFEGPMDLLLHLVREQEVEIHEIEISKVVDGYLAYLDSLERLDIEVAGDFLVMAATLMAIKSRSLLPREEVDLEEELDPRDELIQKLLEYRRFKGLAEDLDSGLRERARMLPGGTGEGRRPPERELDLGDLTPWDLLASYSRLMRETLADRPHRIEADPRPLRYYVERVIDQLEGGQALTLRNLLDALGDLPPREALIGSFCALLELVRLELVEVRQLEGAGRDLSVSVRADRSGELRDTVRHALLDEDVVAAEASPEDPSAPAEPVAGPRARTDGETPEEAS